MPTVYNARAVYSSHGLVLRALVQCEKERSPRTHGQQRTELLWDYYKTDTSSHHGEIQVEGQRNQTLPIKGVGTRDCSWKRWLFKDNLGRRRA